MLAKSLIFSKNSSKADKIFSNDKLTVTSFSLNATCEKISASTTTSTSIFTRPNFLNY
ncbi:hypothetical protein DDB_G0276637 [Dictyostelium discoideum AX4]|uniref:Uncharacterized protein n=1 Tax=Dictyostelium discoideum TaxID=44689 RepID=Q551E6_DICDI|nr:hypothetical protein DDB_G0276637 [Dictyostelium discoideum AX4]EAL69131.1 hypothetical protein DDB_G0276637 [Dictyostelium discoideum AX4]|eukprot:XP_643047.1 hypothetical protein DDB_G0276637 [Dictyostelium discoideum AX4]